MTEFEAGFRLGNIEVWPMEGLIDGPAGRVRVEPKAMAVLVQLARSGGHVCSRDQIQQAVWPRGFTTDDVLTRCISQLRKALGDDPRAPEHLETLPRRGYRLLSQPSPPHERTQVSGLGEAPSVGNKLIVLPFQYLSAAAEDYIADGMTELLTARLAVLPGVSVISRTTAMRFKGVAKTLDEIAKQTGAHWVVEGSVLQSGDRMQVVVQLIDTRTDAHLWANDFLRNVGDMLLLQNDIARDIAGAIRVQVGVDSTGFTPSVALPTDIMRDYLLGRQKLSRRSAPELGDAIESFSRVCAKAPKFAPAWASRAEARLMMCHYGMLTPSEAEPACRADLEEALRLEPDLAMGFSARGAMRFFFEHDVESAEKDLLRAIELGPGLSIAMMALANVYAVQKRFEDADFWLEQALLIDPLDVGINMNAGDHRILQRRFEEAIAALDKALALEPDHRAAGLRRCWARSLAGNPAAATSELNALGPRDQRDWQWFEYATLVSAASEDGAVQRHWKALQRVSDCEFVPPWSLARAAAAARDYEQAVGWLQKAVQIGSTSVPFVAVTPAFDDLHGRADFQAIATGLKVWPPRQSMTMEQ